MCGIAGILCLDRQPRACANAVHKMADAMAHRGPDDEGYLIATKQDNALQVFGGRDTPPADADGCCFFPSAPIETAYSQEGHLFLGHRRLSIVDLSTCGHQPMSTADRRYWIVYNGEIYNYKDIARTLADRGVRFASRTDTEVLLYAYREWGPDMLPRLNGMFAFAIWDDTDKTLFCARDHVGIKPFYYTIQDGLFVFASDIKTLISSGIYEPGVDLEGLYHVMAYGVAPRPLTAFKDVRSLRQGYWLGINDSGDMKENQYWRVPVGTQDHNLTESEATDLLQTNLQDAVRRRLAADVPVGTFMSGGLDSTTISAMAAMLSPGIKAFTLGFRDEDQHLDETTSARATAGIYNMQHVVEMVRVDEVLDDLQDVIRCYEEPYYSLSPNYLISRLASRNGVPVVLNGLGGDELFGGYRYYRWTKAWRLLRLMAPLVHCFRRWGPRADQIAAAARATSLDQAYSVFHATLTDASRHKLFHAIEVRDVNSAARLRQLYVPDDMDFADDFEALSYMDMMHYIGNHHTYRLDQFTMRFSLEARVPFLDPDVIQTAFRIPTRLKFRGNTGKYVLRKVAQRLIHPASLKMKKKGFSLPMARWMHGPLRELIDEKIDRLTQRELFVPEIVRRYRDEFETGRRDYRALWQLVAVELWMELFID